MEENCNKIKFLMKSKKGEWVMTNYRSVIDDLCNEVDEIIDNVYSDLEEILRIVKSIPEDEVSEEINGKLGEIEEVADMLLFELKE